MKPAFALAIGLAVASLHGAAQAADRPAATTTKNANAQLSATEYASKAAMSDMFEIQSARVALDTSKSDAIRSFAQHMIDDHTKSTDKLKQAATAQSLPPALDADHTKKLGELRAATPAQFDQKYAAMQVQAHRTALQLHRGYAQHGTDPGLKSFAAEVAPIVQDHLKMARALPPNQHKKKRAPQS